MHMDAQGKRGMAQGMNKGQLPELLAPAGNMDRLHTALTYGADAIYLGGQELNLRAQSKGFTWPELASSLEIIHSRGKKGYFCLNILPTEADLPLLDSYLERVKELPFDGLIIADPGIFNLAIKKLPHIPIHLSTQANTTNSLSVSFWKRMGVQRINLARELSLKEISQIRRNNPDIELEIFVHGAMCMAISGHCHLSAYLNQRSANKGLCAHPCRYNYRPRGLLLEEEKRPGRIVWQTLEEHKYTSILASDDLCLVKYLPWFMHKHIDALKIEGRMKTSSYLAQVVDVYKTALQEANQNRFRPFAYLHELGMSSSRNFCSGFFLPQKRITLPCDALRNAPSLVWAKVLSREKDDKWLLSIRHRWNSSLGFHILKPGLHRPFIEPSEYRLENLDGQNISLVHSGSRAWLRCQHPDLGPGLMLRGRQA